MIGRYHIAAYRAFDFFELVLGLASLAISILGIWEYFFSDTDNLNSYIFATLMGVTLAALAKILKLRESAQNRLNNFSKTLHGFSDYFRNNYYELMTLYNTKTLTLEALNAHALRFCQTAVDLLADALTISSGQNVRVSIKYFPPPSKGIAAPKSIDDYLVATFVRSSNSPESRMGHDLVKVKDNTGYQLVVSHQYNHFRAQDLEMLSRELSESDTGGYRTTNPNWRDYYRSLIIVPIRINRSYLQSKKGGDGYHIIGLLTADSASTSAFPSKEIDAYTHFLKGFADVLYIYLEKIEFYLNKLQKRKNLRKIWGG